MTDGERLEEIVETAVARGDAPGVVAAAAVPRRDRHARGVRGHSQGRPRGGLTMPGYPSHLIL